MIVVGQLSCRVASGSINAEGNLTYNLSVSDDYIPHLYKFDNSGLKSFNFKPRIGYKLTNNELTNAASGSIFIGDAGGTKVAYSGSDGYATMANNAPSAKVCRDRYTLSIELKLWSR